jgi:hypothetical protein
MNLLMIIAGVLIVSLIFGIGPILLIEYFVNKEIDRKVNKIKKLFNTSYCHVACERLNCNNQRAPQSLWCDSCKPRNLKTETLEDRKL